MPQSAMAALWGGRRADPDHPHCRPVFTMHTAPPLLSLAASPSCPSSQLAWDLPKAGVPFLLGSVIQTQCKVDVHPAGPDTGQGWISSCFSVSRKKCPFGGSPEDRQLQWHPFPLDGGGWGCSVPGPTAWCPESRLDFTLSQHLIPVSWVHSSAASEIGPTE